MYTSFQRKIVKNVRKKWRHVIKYGIGNVLKMDEMLLFNKGVIRPQ